MSLLDIKNHMLQVKIASLNSLCLFFSVTPEMMRMLLDHWVKKGKLKCCKKKPACGSKCFKCPETTVEIYEWIDSTPHAV